MRILVNLNVLLDVLQSRRPYYADSARALSDAVRGRVAALIPGHSVTTLYYIIARQAGKSRADEAVDWMLNRFGVAVCNKDVLLRARALALADYEDAVVAAMAERELCDAILTRNVADFSGSPIPAITPAEFVKRNRR